VASAAGGGHVPLPCYPFASAFSPGPAEGQEAVFRHSPVRAGRSRDNDLQFPDSGDPTSSGHHAEFVFEQGAWWIVDLGSTNGTTVNGARVTRARLRHRDRVVCGGQHLEVRLRAATRHRGTMVALAAVLVIALGWIAWRAGGRGPLDHIAASAQQSTYLLVIQEGNRRTPVGTAFAVDRDGRLATNAHVAAPLAPLLSAGDARVAYAVSADAHERPRRVTGITLHPAWRPGSVAHDAAIVTVEGPPTRPLRLAREIPRDAGATIAVYGFPAAVTEPDRPQGSLAVNVIREVRGAQYLLVGISVGPGSSGSPVFTTDGVVVGMIAGSHREPGQVAAASGGGVAVSAAVVRELLDAR
jgi:S1-C subfamily serine protease